MGLDLCVEGRSLPGHEVEWESMVRSFFSDDEISDADFERFDAISQPAYASLGAPRVGSDAAADDWIAAQLADKMTREEAVAEYEGFYALALVESDGVPDFTHAGLYEGVDETSFRGKFLECCTKILTEDMIGEAWNHQMPGEAESYGQRLLAAASDARNGKTMAPRKRSLFGSLFGRSKEEVSLDEQLKIVESAGKWFVFWGSQGHPIRAYF